MLKFITEISYEDQALDIMNKVNATLHDAGYGLQYALHDVDQNDDIPSLFYSLEIREDLVQE